MTIEMKMKKSRGGKAANNSVSFATTPFSAATSTTTTMMMMVVVMVAAAAAAMVVDLVDSTTATTTTNSEDSPVVRSIHGGDRRRRNRQLMVNGFDTEPYEFPFHTKVGCCSGALIAPDVVLTASHDVPEDPTGMTVTVNAYYTDNTEPHLLEAPPSSSSSSSSPGKDGEDDGDVTTPSMIGVDRIISEFYRHPKSDNMHYDFTVLILDEPVSRADNDQIRPIRINRSPDFPTEYQHVTLLGMGTTNLTGTDRPDVLQRATTSYIPNEECRQSFDPSRGISYGGSFLDDTSICTHNITATSSSTSSSSSSSNETTTKDGDNGDGCVFDSGGPVIAKRAGTGRADDDDDGDDNGNDNDDGDEYLLIGLISFGVDCADPVYPAVNARVSAVSGWIDDVVCQHSRSPPSDFRCSANGKRPTVAPPRSLGTVATIFWMIALSFVVVALIVLFIVWKKKKTATNTEGSGDLSLGERQSLLA